MTLAGIGLNDLSRVSGPVRLADATVVGAFLLVLLAAAMAPEWRVLASLALALVVALIVAPTAIFRALTDRSLPVLALLVPAAGLLLGEPDREVWGLALSGEGLSIGGRMLVRAAAILVGVYTLTYAVSIGTIAGLFERAGLTGIGFAFGVAVNVLPTVRDNFEQSLVAIRLRGGFRRQPLRSARALAVAVLVSTVRHAEEMVVAAEARGFRVGGSRPRPLGMKRRDWAFLAVQLGLALAIVIG